MKNILKNKKLLLEWTLRTILAVVFISRAIPAFMGNPEWVTLFTNIGISIGMAKILLIFIGISDTLIAIFLIAKPIRVIIIWAIIWPIVPAIGTLLAGASTEFVIEHYGSMIIATTVLLYLRGFPKSIKQLLSK